MAQRKETEAMQGSPRLKAQQIILPYRMGMIQARKAFIGTQNIQRIMDKNQ